MVSYESWNHLEKQPFFYFAVIFVIHIFIGGAIAAYLLQNIRHTHTQNGKKWFILINIESGWYITIHLNDFIIHVLAHDLRRADFRLNKSNENWKGMPF